ncbi:MAG: DNA mismatch repair protein MutS, partial [Firmicutes bacterium]|nr:DNA mismatch repair protein MutS [Bacillota bacterium]
MALSPMMQQYLDIKEQYKDCILFFRLGDFYEMFFDDAMTASRELELTLTGRNCGLEERAPMCGVPFHSCDPYIAKLVEKGYKVAICEQLEDPAEVKGLVKRDIVRIVTPGTVISQAMLKENENNYLASVFYSEESIGFAYCDVSTGEISASQFTDISSVETLVNELVKISAREVLIDEKGAAAIDTDKIRDMTGAYFEVLDEGHYSRPAALDGIMRQFRVKSLFGLGLDEESPAVYALGALLQYLRDTQKQEMGHMTVLNVYETGNHMSLDKATIRNLEITETLYDKQLRGSLLGVLDKTGTAMGSRKMKQWLREPLNDAETIKDRLDAVEYLSDEILLRNDLRASLRQIYDFERLAGRVACGNANGKDMIALRNSCAILPDIKTALAGSGVPLIDRLAGSIHELTEVKDKIESAICEDPPFIIKEG